MNQNNAIDRLREHLLTKQPTQAAAIADLVAEIAGDPTAIAELAAMMAAITGEPSNLAASVEHLLAYQASRDLLGAYVDAELAGQDASRLYPQVAHHLQNYLPLREEYTMLLESLQADAQDTFGAAPSAVNFATWYAQQQSIPSPVSSSAGVLWQQVAQGVNRLVAAIPVWLDKNLATFGELPAALTPQLAPAPVYRQRAITLPGEEEVATVWTLPLSIDDRHYTLRFSTVENGRATLVLEVAHHQPAQPVGQVRVILNDQVGDLLESTTTSGAGLAFFRNLETGVYQIQVEYTDQMDEFTFTLHER